mgnify:CR=1 FL=1
MKIMEIALTDFFIGTFFADYILLIADILAYNDPEKTEKQRQEAVDSTLADVLLMTLKDKK